ncbi:MAG: hypothetical protein GKC10_06075 [Methanosarcinales archaeon]|nr:hypothetical protein [Methanosarcinales archaeon]
MASRRDVLLALTNVLFAASGLGGLLTLYFDLTGRELAQVPPQYQRALGALLLLAALAFGLIEFSVTRDSRRAEGRGADQARAMVAGQVLAIIHSMDARLGYVEQVLAADQFAQRLQAVRERVAPALQEMALAGYRELIQQQRASQLRQSFNGAPLHLDQAGALSSSLLEAGLDPGLLQGFLQCLSGVRDSSENLLAALQRASSADGGKAWIDHRGRRVELEWEILKVRSLLAHLAGLQALGVLAGRRGGTAKPAPPSPSILIILIPLIILIILLILRRWAISM